MIPCGVRAMRVCDRLTQRREIADVRTSVVYEHLRTAVLSPHDEPDSSPPR